MAKKKATKKKTKKPVKKKAAKKVKKKVIKKKSVKKTTKTVTKARSAPSSKPKQSPIGEVIHWYDQISVAVVRLNKPLRVGDTVTVRRGDIEFTHTISSMQFDHQQITSGKKGQEIAIKLPQIAKEGAQLFS